MGDDWKRLSRYIGSAQGNRSIEKFAKDLGVSGRTLGDLLRGDRTRYQGRILRKIENGLGWAPGDVDRILVGGSPTKATGGGEWFDVSSPLLSDDDRSLLRAIFRARGVPPTSDPRRNVS